MSAAERPAIICWAYWLDEELCPKVDGDQIFIAGHTCVEKAHHKGDHVCACGRRRPLLPPRKGGA